jgi:hypothetical protein
MIYYLCVFLWTWSTHQNTENHHVGGLPMHNNSQAATILGISENGRQFTVNDRPTFLLGISYYGATSIERPEVWQEELKKLHELGFNWVRIWITWAHGDEDFSAVDRDGNLAEPYWTRFKDMVAYCNQIGMVVDVTFSRNRLSDHQAHVKSVAEVARQLQLYRNLYIDVGNERNVKDSRFVSLDEVAELIAAIKEVDPERICTASDGSDISTEGVAPRIAAGLDLLCPHRRRDSNSPAETRDDARRLLKAVEEAGRIVPIHYQEPFRRDYSRGWEPTASEFLADLDGAVRGGAAGWCFHNGSSRHSADKRPYRSFDMSKRGLFEQLDREESDVVDAAALVVEQAQQLPDDVPFTVFAERTGDTGGLEGVPPYGGHGVGLVDISKSGLEDVYISNCGVGTAENIFALNRGGFQFNVLPEAGGAAMVFGDLDEWSHGFAFADFDNDGHYELFVSAAKGPYRLFRWMGDSFEDITPGSGIQGENHFTRGVVAADLTGDSSLDIFCLNNRGEPNDLFLNDGHGHFTRANTAALGLADPRPRTDETLKGLGQGVTAADFDNDGEIEIYTCIRFLPNRLWKRQDDGTWRDIAPEAGVNCIDGGDGAVFADLWNRGLLDLIVSGSDLPETPYLRIYRNRGDGTFEDLTHQYRIRSKSYHVTVADFNADGWLDLYVTRDYEPNCLYLNDGRGNFIPVRAGVETELSDTRCSATADLDGDGRLDLVVAQKRDINASYRNLSACLHWVKLSLIGSNGDPGAFGARVTVFRSGALDDPEALIAFREARTAYGYVGQDTPDLTIGLGDERACDIRVQFPNGAQRVVRDVESGTAITIDASKQ